MTADSSLHHPAAPSGHKRQTVLLVTGLSGAGKSTALQVLEDLGWEAIDNFPIRLLSGLINDICELGSCCPLAIGFDTRTRGFAPAEIMALVKELSTRDTLEVSTLFLDCGSAELERRYNETRRPHPIAKERQIGAAIRSERELLEPLRRWADAVIDTSQFSSHQLQQTIRERFSGTKSREMSIVLYSFGFARGMPPMADLVFDMRYLDNPHWVPDLRAKTGLDNMVGAHISADPIFAKSFAQIRDLLITVLPEYQAQGKSYVTIAFGCTGGKHRSVFVASQMDKALRDGGFFPTIIHRDLSSRGANLIEGEHLA